MNDTPDTETPHAETARPIVNPVTGLDQYGTTWVTAMVDPDLKVLAGRTSEGTFCCYTTTEHLYEHATILIDHIQKGGQLA